MLKAERQLCELDDGEIVEPIHPAIDEDKKTTPPLADQNETNVFRPKRKYSDVESVKNVLINTQKRLTKLFDLDADGAEREVQSSRQHDGEDELALVERLSKRLVYCEDTIGNLRKQIADNNRVIDHIKNIVFVTTRNHVSVYPDMCEIANRGSRVYHDAYLALIVSSPKMWNTLLENGYGDDLCIKKDVHILMHGVSVLTSKKIPMLVSRLTQLLHYVNPKLFARNYEGDFIKKINRRIASESDYGTDTVVKEWENFRKIAIALGFK